MLALGRALMSGPRVLVIDEASLGLTPEVVWRIWEALGILQRSGLTILAVEQHVTQSITMSQRFYLLDRGRLAYSGAPESLHEEGLLEKVYLGSR